MTFNADEIRKTQLDAEKINEQRSSLEKSVEFKFQKIIVEIERKIEGQARWGGPHRTDFDISTDEEWYVLRWGCPRWNENVMVMIVTALFGVRNYRMRSYYGDERNLSTLGQKVIAYLREKGFKVEMKTPWSDGHHNGSEDSFGIRVSW